jgi:hypothetical protein
MFRLYKNRALVPWGICYKQQDRNKKVRLKNSFAGKLTSFFFRLPSKKMSNLPMVRRIAHLFVVY